MKIPRDVSGAQLAKALRTFGYAIVRQDGSHVRLTTEQNGQHSGSCIVHQQGSHIIFANR